MRQVNHIIPSRGGVLDVARTCPDTSPCLPAPLSNWRPDCRSSRCFSSTGSPASALDLAKVSNDLGALIVFEPSGIGDPKLFREAWSLAHVIKYSHERLRDIADLELGQSDHIGVLLEIETLGADGLRYRSRLPKIAANGWQPVDALETAGLQGRRRGRRLVYCWYPKPARTSRPSGVL